MRRAVNFIFKTSIDDSTRRLQGDKYKGQGRAEPEGLDRRTGTEMYLEEVEEVKERIFHSLRKTQRMGQPTD